MSIGKLKLFLDVTKGRITCPMPQKERERKGKRNKLVEQTGVEPAYLLQMDGDLIRYTLRFSERTLPHVRQGRQVWSLLLHLLLAPCAATCRLKRRGLALCPLDNYYYSRLFEKYKMAFCTKFNARFCAVC